LGRDLAWIDDFSSGEMKYCLEVAESIPDIQAAQPRVGTDWANLGAFQLLCAPSGCLVVQDLARIRPAAQPNR